MEVQEAEAAVSAAALAVAVLVEVRAVAALAAARVPAVASEVRAPADSEARITIPLITIITVPTSVGASVRAAFTAEAAVAQAR